ncbi:phosphotransferase family protein [Pseudomonas putida]|uniref:phosphotransferase family protein n=1 Tax=Pseudomonas putida TaxID=303 RepID=UPI002363BA6D|nr:phosphotransferase family protein [Pseudomonas putida]MDD2058386.1 phosphotransferase family protein [Pseudomonas putida]
MDNQQQQRLAEYLATTSHASSAQLTTVRLLSGGAIQENWLVDAEFSDGPHAGIQALVVRSDAASGVASSHGRAQEFALVKAAYDAGVTVPEPLSLCTDVRVLGRPFFVMRRIQGTASAHLICRPGSPWGGDRGELAERLGREMARIHSIRLPHPELEFLPSYDQAPSLYLIEKYRAFLDSHHTAYPALEWGLRWLERHAPQRDLVVLCHRDLRTGNYMVDENGLTGIIDWEFAGWSDPLEDIGWFCAKCWRFGQDALEAGGIGEREAFYRGYEVESGRTIPREHVRYWEVMAHLHWAIVSIQQAERHQTGEENSLLLALTGHITPQLEWEILNMTEHD